MNSSKHLALVAFGVSIFAACSETGTSQKSSPPSTQTQAVKTTSSYDPVAYANAHSDVQNPEAAIPAQCYTKTESLHNPCWVCHTLPKFPNLQSDWELQEDYDFSDIGRTNHWSNLFVDHRPAIAAADPDEVWSYVRQDNYTPLRQALAALPNYPGYVPDLDFKRGFDNLGFAKDNSDWRAFRYKPFAGTFWPTNGATDDVFIRLPEAFRRKNGKPDRMVYQINLAILEASFGSHPDVLAKDVVWPTEPLDENVAGIDLDQDGKLGTATRLTGLPKNYVGDARITKVRRALYPTAVEFLHTVRYLDPDSPTFHARRMKEVRYSKKVRSLQNTRILAIYEEELNDKEEGKLPVYQGQPNMGLRNQFGWVLQGYIEDAEGRLRVQTREEHMFCMGCHSAIGATLDQTFSFARKVPGASGWAYQDLKGIPDVPQMGHPRGEVATYIERTGGGNEMRANEEMQARFFLPDGSINRTALDEGTLAKKGDLTKLILPSRKRALALNVAYRELVRAQQLHLGRDPVLAPATNVHRQIKEGQETGLLTANKVFTDGQLRLDWSEMFPEIGSGPARSGPTRTGSR